MLSGAIAPQIPLRCQLSFTTAIRKNGLCGGRCARMQRLRLNASLPEVIADPSYARHAWTFGKPTKHRDMPDCRSPCRLAPYLVQIDVPVILLLLKFSAEISVLFGTSIHNEDLLILLSMPGSGPEKPIFRGHEQLQGILIPYLKIFCRFVCCYGSLIGQDLSQQGV